MIQKIRALPHTETVERILFKRASLILVAFELGGEPVRLVAGGLLGGKLLFERGDLSVDTSLPRD